MNQPDPFRGMVDQLAGDSIDQKPTSQRRQAGDRWLTLTLKRNGKVASGRDVFRRALAVYARQVKARGAGGGIVELLISRTEKEEVRVRRDTQMYSLEWVRNRGGGRREQVRNQLSNPALLFELLALCPEAERPSRKWFAGWLHSEMYQVGSKVRLIVAKHAPELLAAKRSCSWIYRQLGKTKMSR